MKMENKQAREKYMKQVKSVIRMATIMGTLMHHKICGISKMH